MEEDVAAWGHDLGEAREAEGFPGPGLRPDPVRGHGEHPVLERPDPHRELPEARHDEVRRVGHEVRPEEGEGPRRLGEEVVVADEEPDPGPPDLRDGEREVPGAKRFLSS